MNVHYFEQGNQSPYARKEKQIHFNWKISKLIHGHATLRFVMRRVKSKMRAVFHDLKCVEI